MKILSAEQTKALDAYTIENEPIASVDLMERASASFADWFTAHFKANQPVSIFCGTGNNGGDGLAIARMLHEKKYSVEVSIVYYSTRTSADFDTNYKRLEPLLPVKAIHKPEDIVLPPQENILVDAIFGSGLNRPAEGIAAAVIDALNKSKAVKVAVDIPSGLYVDMYNSSPYIMEAAYTVSFQLPKLSFLLPQNFRYVGEWHLTDIGLHPEGIQQARTDYYYTDKAMVSSMVRKRSKYDHKGSFGHALIIAGSYGKIGAAQLAVKACLVTGVGLLTAYVPACGYEIMQIAVPEAMTLTDPQEKLISAIPSPEKFTTIGIGPGLGTDEATATAMTTLLGQYKSPVVVDADGLNILARKPDLLKQLPAGSILTPHPKEFERLAGQTANEYQRLEVLQKFARQHQVVVVLKGAHSAIATPEGKVYFNSTGNPGMATGGTGDVLTGIITSLLAQKYTPAEAAVLGVYFHGLAGDCAAGHTGFSALTASDIISYLPQAFIQYNL
jgi:ADP-dependent NAD(P)H-hydrate dehydratase / NAD(P)H-hydrate epimerase